MNIPRPPEIRKVLIYSYHWPSDTAITGLQCESCGMIWDGDIGKDRIAKHLNQHAEAEENQL